MNNPTLETSTAKSMFFIEKDGERFPVSYVKGTVIIRTYGVSVVFSKSNRSSYFHDSRSRKPISTAEMIEEVTRLMDNKTESDKAIAYLCRIQCNAERNAL